MIEGARQKTVGRDVTVAEIMPEILSDLPYYRRSGGGLTLSGGEVLAQADFARDLLRAAKEAGLHTAIETSASLPYTEIEKLLPYLDLVMMDIKHMDPEKHREYTGVDNSLILANAQTLAASGVELIIRTPVVPGVNDSENDIREIAKFVRKLGGVSEYHLLPYHRLGSDKYNGLGRQYSLKEIEPPTKERMTRLLSVAEESGVKCQIGG